MTDHLDDENNEVDDNNNDENEESFADMLDAYSQGAGEDVRIGDKIRGKIVSIGRDSVFIDTGTKIDGVVEKAELLDKAGELTFEAGDTLELYVVALAEDEIRLSKAVSGIGGFQMLKEAYEKGTTVLYFFPAAYTGVCTKSSCQIRDEIGDFQSVNAQIFGI